MAYERQNSISQDSPLEDLAAAARGHHQDVLDCGLNALRAALDAGDVLTWAKNRCPHRGWKRWRAENCPKISQSTDELYRRLAAHREIIECELKKNPDLSINDARALITTPKTSNSKLAEPVDLWRTLTSEEKKRGLVQDGLKKALQEYVPADWFDELSNRAARANANHKKVSDRPLTRLFCKLAMHHVRGETKEAFQAGIELANYITEAGIDTRLLDVRVDAGDAPPKRRPALIQGPAKIIEFPGSDRAHQPGM